MTPRATYRLQFHKAFGFDDAVALMPYLKGLGVSHLYASPFLKSHPGSTHGYDIVDHAALNPELGGEEGFARLANALSQNDLKLILDYVPNHMGVGGADNAIWLDLLEWGQEADHAGWFDVDWSPDRTDIKGKVLVPLMGSQYGIALESGQLCLRFDADEGSFAIWAHEAHKLPVCPIDYETVLGRDDPVLERLGGDFSDLPQWHPQVMRRVRDLKAELAAATRANPAIATAVEVRLACFNGATHDPESWARLDTLIGRQNWKPAHFLVAGDDINYRRFFNIATLAGLRMELPDVFDGTHKLVFRLIERGLLDGLRIDHIDGLFDPKAYLDRLRADAPKSKSGGPIYLVVEKILGHDEPLRADWPVDGTTGYEFTNLLTGLFVHPPAEPEFTCAYRTFTGETRPFDEIVLASKLQIIDNEMSSELHRLARAATRVARQTPRTVDFTLTVLQRALRLIVAAFPVYRTYIDGESAPTAEDLGHLDHAITAARRIDSAIDPSVFDFMSRLLSGALVTEPRSGYRRSDVFRCVMKLQQYCGPVMAKGVEDTAFYRYYRFVALNEVGGAPDRFGTTVEAFHAANSLRVERWPSAMLATSTHDTKRGEDTRARLAALTTLPDEWPKQVRAWNEVLRGVAGSPIRPDRNDEYLFYQLLAGTWPALMLGDAPIRPEDRDGYATRLKAVMTKSFREAKVHSTWIAPDEPYETAALAFIDDAFCGTASDRFMAAIRPFVTRLARLGASNTFAQTVLKFTVPGMPDIYQGAELWDLTMVDPDNRRPVDFTVRQAALAAIEAGPADQMRGLWAGWPDGHFKLALTRTLLDLRRREPHLLQTGSYEPVTIHGPHADRFCAFVRRFDHTTLLVLTIIYPAEPTLDGAQMTLPAGLSTIHGRNLVSGEDATVADGDGVAHALDGLPALVLLSKHA